MRIFSLFSGLFSFLKEVQLEIRKVNWPTSRQTMRDTFVVILFSVAVAIFLGGFDFVFGQILQRFVL